MQSLVLETRFKIYLQQATLAFIPLLFLAPFLIVIAPFFFNSLLYIKFSKQQAKNSKFLFVAIIAFLLTFFWFMLQFQYQLYVNTHLRWGSSQVGEFLGYYFYTIFYSIIIWEVALIKMK